MTREHGRPGPWPLLRQLAGPDRLGLGAAVRSKRTDELRPRVSVADKVVKSVCPFCAVGCGQNVYVQDGRVTQIEGNPDSPVSRGRLNMLRVFKVTSPMSVGTWLVSGYAPLALAAAASAVTGRMPRAGLAATAGAAALGPAVAAYTSVLLADTAAPAWHEAYRELPYLFVGSAATAAGGLGLLAVAPERARPAAQLAALGAAAELTAEQLLHRRLGPAARPYRTGRSGALVRSGQVLAAGGTAAALLGRRNRVLSGLAGAALLAGSAVTRFGIFEAGRASARDPGYTILPQRDRVREREQSAAGLATG